MTDTRRPGKSEKRVFVFPRKPSHYVEAIEPKKAGRFLALISAFPRLFFRSFLTLTLRSQEAQQAAFISSQVA
jgi:hypothetical protein